MRFFAALVFVAPLYAQCSYVLDKTTVNVPATATATSTITVTVMPAICRWLASVNAGTTWLHLAATSQQVMTGGGSFTFSVDPNPIGAARTGTITITTENTLSQFVNVTQEAAVCNFSLSPSTLGFP